MSQALIEHLWQSTWFAVAAALATRALRNHAARIRYGVWFAASIKFLLPFAALSWLGAHLQWRHATAAPVMSESLINTLRAVGQPLAMPQIGWQAPTQSGIGSGLLLALWATGCAALLTRWIWQWARINAAASRAAPMDIAAPVPVRSMSQACEPGVVGIFRPVLLLPEGITRRLTPRQLQAVLAHELCHIRRRDNLTAAVHMLMQSIFWFHPLTWWIGARLVEERERACDENVLELGNESIAYAEGILKVCQLYLESKLPCVAGVSGADLKKRIEVIMSHSVAKPLTPVKRALLALAAAPAVVLPLAVGLLGPPRVAAQDDASSGPATFEAVRIVKADPGMRVFFKVSPTGTFSTTRVPLRDIIGMAYGVDPSRVVGGPTWIDTQGLYDITARMGNTSSASAGPSNFEPPRQAIKALLASRFGLVAHPQTQTIPAYVMRVDAGGSKLTLAPQGEPGPRVLMGSDLVGSAAPVKALTGLFSWMLGAPVVDQTGLVGEYDFHVTGRLTPATLPAALRDQLGLTLEPLTMPVDVLVIDNVQQPSLDARPLAGVTAPDVVKR